MAEKAEPEVVDNPSATLIPSTTRTLPYNSQTQGMQLPTTLWPYAQYPVYEFYPGVGWQLPTFWPPQPYFPSAYPHITHYQLPPNTYN